jgi:hypothetical protein
MLRAGDEPGKWGIPAADRSDRRSAEFASLRVGSKIGWHDRLLPARTGQAGQISDNREEDRPYTRIM